MLTRCQAVHFAGLRAASSYARLDEHADVRVGVMKLNFAGDGQR